MTIYIRIKKIEGFHAYNPSRVMFLHPLKGYIIHIFLRDIFNILLRTLEGEPLVIYIFF